MTDGEGKPAISLLEEQEQQKREFGAFDGLGLSVLTSRSSASSPPPKAPLALIPIGSHALTSAQGDRLHSPRRQRHTCSHIDRHRLRCHPQRGKPT
jgi:hypothetical protein